MVFNSYFFILFFLPITVLGYYALNRIWKDCMIGQWFLLLMSLWFYAFANIYYLPVILGSIFFNYIIYLLMRRKYKSRLLLAAAVAVNLGILLYFKYYNFFIDNTNMFLGTSLSIRKIMLPLGISFITFQQIAFVADVYKGKAGECSFREYALFVSFFPHIISGPIVTYEDFIPLLQDKMKRKVDWDRFSAGIYLFAMGLGKKVLFADVLAKSVDYGYANPAGLNTTSAVFISIAYMIQIYFDFSGYSDMAIGVSRMLNLDLPMNFNSPYKAKTVSEFWNRWHITLTKFFTRYLYIPLGGSRKGKVRTWINTMIIFLCSGFWHGASWTYILWGFCHGVAMIFTKKFKDGIERIPGVISWVLTMFFMITTLVVFRSGSFGTLREMGGVLLANEWGELNPEICEFFHTFLMGWSSFLPEWFAAAFYVVVSTVIILGCKNTGEKVEEFRFSWQSGVLAVAAMFLSILSFSTVSTYIYINF